MSDVSQPSTVIALPTLNASGTLTVATVDDQFVMPFNAELLNVTAVALTGPTVTNATLDIFAGAASIYGGTQANLAQAIDASQTVIYVSEVAGMPNIVKNQTIKIGSEICQVTKVDGAAGQVGVGGGTSQSGVSYDPNMKALTVTRGFLGTTAATALVNATVLSVVPTLGLVASGASNTGTVVAKPTSPNLTAGQVISIHVLAVGSAGPTKVSVLFHFAKR